MHIEVHLGDKKFAGEVEEVEVVEATPVEETPVVETPEAPVDSMETPTEPVTPAADAPAS